MSVLDHGLSQPTVNEIHGILARFPQVEKAVLFGSRAKGVHRNGSDIDLALMGDEGLNSQTLGQIEEVLDDSFLPYRFSLVIPSCVTDPAVRAHIRRVGVLFYTRDLHSAQPLLRRACAD